MRAKQRTGKAQKQNVGVKDEGRLQSTILPPPPPLVTLCHCFPANLASLFSFIFFYPNPSTAERARIVRTVPYTVYHSGSGGGGGARRIILPNADWTPERERGREEVEKRGGKQREIDSDCQKIGTPQTTEATANEKEAPLEPNSPVFQFTGCFGNGAKSSSRSRHAPLDPAGAVISNSFPHSPLRSQSLPSFLYFFEHMSGGLALALPHVPGSRTLSRRLRNCRGVCVEMNTPAWFPAVIRML